MRFCSLGSGSSGNSTLVEASQGITTTRVLIDAGFSERELTRRLARAGCAPADVDAIFVTHEHGDHVGCALKFAGRHRIPLLTSRGTWRAIAGKADLDVDLLRFARSDEVIAVGDIELAPFAVPHDANEPLQLCLSDGEVRLVDMETGHEVELSLNRVARERYLQSLEAWRERLQGLIGRVRGRYLLVPTDEATDRLFLQDWRSMGLIG